MEPKVVFCKRMERIFSRGQGEWAAQCTVLDKSTPRSKDIHIDIQPILKKHKKVFDDIPPRLPPKRGFEHIIELEKGAQLVITTPYRYSQKFEETEKTINELLEMGYIRPSSSPFTSSVSTMRMHIDY